MQTVRLLRLLGMTSLFCGIGLWLPLVSAQDGDAAAEERPTAPVLFQLRNPDLLERLELTDEQQAEVERIADEALTNLRTAGSREAAQELMQAAAEKVKAELSDEQWQQLQQAAQENPFGRRMGRRPGGDRPAGNREGEAPVVEGEPSGPAADAPRPGGPRGMGPFRGPRDGGEPPAGERPTVSFDSRTGNANGEAGERKLSFNFRYAPWEDVLRLYANEAGLTLDLNDVPPGTFSYFDDSEYTATEALDVLNGYLLPKGYALVRRDRFLVSLNIEDGLPPNLVPSVSISELKDRGNYDLVRVVIPLDGLDPEEAAEDVQPLLGPQGSAVPLRNSKSLAVTGTAGNLKRIAQVLGGELSGDEDIEFRSIHIKHIVVTEAERSVRRLFGLPESSTAEQQLRQRVLDPRMNWGRGRGDDRSPQPQQPTTRTTDSKLQVTSDLRTNTLLVTGTADELEIVESVVESLDTDDPSVVMPDTDAPTLKVYSIKDSDPDEVEKTIEALMPGIVVSTDDRYRKIHIMGTEVEHVRVQALIDQLGGNEERAVAVMYLSKLDPAGAAGTLRSLFDGDGNDAPVIEADTTGRRLIVRGTESQVAQVRSVLKDLGEDGTAPAAGGSTDTVRSYSLGGRDQQEFLDLLQRAWSAREPNDLRVLQPPRVSPIRDRILPGNIELEPAANSTQRSRDSGTPQTRRSNRDFDDAVDVERPARISQSPFERRTPSNDFARTIPKRRGPSVKVSFSATGDPVRTQPVVQRDERPAAEPRRQPLDISGIAGEIGLGAEADAKVEAEAEAEAQVGSDAETVDVEPAAERQEQVESPAAGEPPIAVQMQGSELVVSSEDVQALNRFEELMGMIGEVLPPRTRWTVFYLQSADATETSSVLEKLFPDSSVEASSPVGGGIFGSLGTSFSSAGRSVMNATGLSSLGSSASQLRIVPDTRMNALFVSGPSDQVQDVEDVLAVIDSQEIPESLRDRLPRNIQLQYADATTVKGIVENIYSDYMTAPPALPGGGERGGRGGGNPFAMLMAATAAGQGGGNQGIRLALAVDEGANQLIVSSSESLFRQIEELVLTIDENAAKDSPTIRIVPIGNADPQMIRDAVGAIMPKVVISTSSSSSSAASSTRGTAAGIPTRPGPEPSEGDDDAARRIEEFRRAMEQRMRERMQSGEGPGGFQRRPPFGGRGGDDGGRPEFGGRPQFQRGGDDNNGSRFERFRGRDRD